MGWEHLAKVRELSACKRQYVEIKKAQTMLTVQAETVEDLENEEHCNRRKECIAIIGWHKVRNKCRFHYQACHAAKNAESDILIPWEEVDNEDGADVDTECEGQPCRWIQQLLDGRKA